MRTKLTVAAALGGTLLATCLVSGSAQAASVPVLKGDATPGIVTLVGRGGSRGGHGGMSRSSRGSYGAMSRSSRGSYGAMSRSSRGSYGGISRDRVGKYQGSGGVTRHYGSVGKYRDYGKRYTSKGRDHGYYDRRKRYGSYGYRRYGSYGWYGAPFLAYGAYAGGCGWLYRNAVATGDPYWWNRYYECTGYY
jgi:hypothetical protein